MRAPQSHHHTLKSVRLSMALSVKMHQAASLPGILLSLWESLRE